MNELEQIASGAVKRAMESGATAAECTISEGDEFSVAVRMRQVESLKEAGSRGAGIRILVGQKSGSSYTSDLSADGIETMVRAAINLASITGIDPQAGMPDESELGSLSNDLALYDDAIVRMETDWKIEQALKTEEAALSADPRIENSEGAGFDSYRGMRVFANSLGFTGSYATTSCGLSCAPVAKQNGSMERDYWHTSGRAAVNLESPEHVGRMAAERALRRLNPRKVPTQKVPVIFEPRTARSLLGDLFDAVSGSSIYRHASFLVDKIGQKIAVDGLTIVDDSTMPGRFGTTPFDDEGVRTRRTVIIERGVLKNYMLNSYTARKLGMKTTGNASRGLSGSAGVGPGNLYIEAGETSPEQIIKGVRAGLYVTELIGGDTNTVTGDYSSGAAGMWIENGEFAYPVSEITIAGNLKQMLMDLEYIGSDLEFRGSVASPTLMIREMMISGQ